MNVPCAPGWQERRTRAPLQRALSIAALGIAAGLPAAAQRTPTATATCLACHAMPTLAYPDTDGTLHRLAVDPRAFDRSAHARVACVDCHGNASYPHAGAVIPRVSCDGDCHAVDSAGKPYTHTRQAAELRQSVHGRSDADNPTCLDCHGDGDAHAIARIRAAGPGARMAACVGCHGDTARMRRHDVATDAVSSYERSFHFKAIRFGDTTTAGCTDCHTAHHVLAADDSASTVAAGNVARTCGRSRCHAGARRNFAVSGANHLELRAATAPILRAEQRLFLLLTGGTMMMLVAGIVLDVQKKFGWAALVRRSGRAAARVWALALRPALARSRRATVRVARLLLLE